MQIFTMQPMRWLLYFLFVGVGFITAVDVKKGRQDVLLHEAVRTLLGFKESPEFRGRLLPNPDELSEEAPQYMMDLYERFKNSRISKGHLSGNTVRSINAEIAEVNGETMFVFNLSSVGSSERLLSAEIHLYKRKSKKNKKKRDIDLFMYEIAPHYMSEDGKITMRAESFGWQWYDVTNSIMSCLAARRKKPHLFALNFKTEKPSGKYRFIALKKFIRHHSMPFLVIYSNDTQESRFDQLDDLAEKMLNEKYPTENDRTLSKKSSKSEQIGATNSAQEAKTQKRKRRSIFDNEIPENPEDYEKFDRKFNKIPQTHPGILQSRRGNKNKLSDSQLIPYPKKSRKFRKNRKHRKNRKNRRRKNRRRNRNRNKLVFPKEWDDYHRNIANEENSGSVCGRRKLVVNFADIGWGDWIISPKSFEAHYCAGTCPFPLTKRLRPSNHATIQSMVHAIGIYGDVPAPCCVPDSMSSITLLYFDENRNVVLKNYPSMTVNSCACR